MVKKVQPTPGQGVFWVGRKRTPQAPAPTPPPYPGWWAQQQHAAGAQIADKPRRWGRHGGQEQIAPYPLPPFQPPQLPHLGMGAPPAPLYPHPGLAVGPVAGEQKLSADDRGWLFVALGGLKSFLHKYRWQMTPAYASCATVGAAAADQAGWALLGLGVLGVTGRAAEMAESAELDDVRKGLSQRERRLVWQWAAGAAAWTGVTTAGLPYLDPVSLAGAALFAIATGRPAFQWVWSRRIREPEAPTELELEQPTHSERALQILAAWPYAVAADDAGGLRGSTITDLEEPTGAIRITVQLRPNAHAEEVVNDNTRRWLEVKLGMGLQTAHLETLREDAGKVMLICTPDRHLEKVAATWNGPVLNDDGNIPLAITPDGRDIEVGLHGKSGVEHMVLVGGTDTGKSFTLVACLLPGVTAHREVVWYCDGGLGGSSGHVAGAVDWWAAGGRDDYLAVIKAADVILQHRKRSRGAQGISRWRGKAEKLPILTLVFEEATTIRKLTPAWAHDKVEEFTREGRKHGIRVIQITQDPMADAFLGGRVAREQMAGNGSMIGHRLSGSTSTMLAASSSPTKGGAGGIDLRDLPPEPGWCGIIRKNQTLSKACRVRYADEDAVEKHLDGFVPRGLGAAEAELVGADYAGRVLGTTAAAEMKAARAAEEAEGRDDGANVDLTKAANVDDTHALPPAAAHEVKAPAEIADHAMGAGDEHLVDEDARAVAALYPAVAGVIQRDQGRKQHKRAGRVRAIRATLRTTGAVGMTRKELADLIGAPSESVRRYLRDMRDAGQVAVDADNRWHLINSNQDAA